MFNKNHSPVLNYQKKDLKKVFKTILQIIILLLVSVLLFRAFVDVKKYQEPDKEQWSNGDGFIAVSYFGVSRTGGPKLISKKELDKQLKALHNQGYETISQQDVIDFYEKEKKLPEKALFLSFEDGRNDSSIFSHPSLKRYNYKATFLSYANKMGNSDRKFLQPKDMLSMMKGGYWELGTNGYRLTYINIFDDEANYIGVRDENELRNKKGIEYYNHYLMDFIRDENMIPLENKSEMEKRITEDYRLMKDIYTENLGFVPGVYMIMHANALYGAMNELVSNINDKEINKLFNIHYNLEGNAYNIKAAELNNLTRIQPAPYWFTNHLLMKIQKDTSQKMKFVIGDTKRAEKWKQVGGVTEFMDSRIVLTSPPDREGKLYLSDSDNYRNIKFKGSLAGNVVGRQSIYLRYDQDENSFLRITLENNKVIVEEKGSGSPIKQLDKFELKEIERKTEDLTFNKATVYTNAQTKMGARTPEEEYQVNISETRKFEILIHENRLSILIDDETFLEDQMISNDITKGGIALGSQYHEQNEKDNIYDGVFDDVIIYVLDDDGNEGEILFNNTNEGFSKVLSNIKKAINNIINWVIDTF